MMKYLTIQRLESKRFLPVIMIAGSIIITACCIFLQFGIDTYKAKIEESISFTKLEKGKVNNLQNIQLYQILGYKQIGLINCLYTLFNNSTSFSDLQSLKNEGYRFEINKPEIGANAFEQPLGKSNMDFNWLFLFFGSAAFLILGFITYHKKEKYIKFLTNLAGHRTIFAAILLSKILIIIGFLIVSLLAVLFQFHFFNGIHLSGVEIRNLAVFFFVPCFIIFLFSLLSGMIFGKLRSTFKGVSLAIGCWFLLIIFIPEIFNVTLANHTKSMFDSIYSHELKKLEIFSQAEQSILKEVSKYSTPEEIKAAYKRMIQQYLNGDLKKIIALEEKMLGTTIKAAKKVHLYSIFTPVTFYKSVGNEMTGCSYNGLISFYRESFINYEKFVNYCFKNTIDGKSPKDNPFIKDPEDYVFKLESSLPDYFLAGVLFNFLLLVILVGFAYYRFKLFLFPAPALKEGFKNMDFKYETGKHYSYICEHWDFANQLMNVLMGMGIARKFSGKLSLSGKNIVGEEKQDLVYLPGPAAMPGNIKAGTLLDRAADLLDSPAEEVEKIKKDVGDALDEKFAKLKKSEQVDLLLRIASLKKSSIYVLHDFSFFFFPRNLEKIFSFFKDKLIIEFTKVDPAHDKYDSDSLISVEDSLYIEDKVPF